MRGEWIGNVECKRGQLNLRLTLNRRTGVPGTVGGFAMFKAVDKKIADAGGAFGFSGEVRDGEIRLRPDPWFEGSSRFPPLAIDARMYADPDRLVGRVVNSACSTVDLRRPDSPFAAVAPPLDAKPKVASGPMITYADIVKAIGIAGNNDNEVSRQIVGKTVRLKLIAPGPQSLMVNVKDLLFFTCAVRDPTYRSGSLVATIIGYSNPPEGEPTVMLDRCSKR